MKYLSHYNFPPQNYIAEEILLGTILINPSILPHIIPLIKAESFFLEYHQLIYKHLIELHKQNKIHPMELLYCLNDTKKLHKVGGLKKITELMKQSQVFTSSIHINRYIKELVELINNAYIKRLMIQYGYNIIRLAYIKKFSSYKLYNLASHYLNITVKKIPKERIGNFKDLISEFLLNIKNTTNTKQILISPNPSIESGFIEIDKLTNGLPNGDLIVIAGRPSMGKTSLAINIANNILNNYKIGLCIFSLEMSRQQILHKLISIASSISTQNIILNKISINEWNNIQKICHKFLKAKIYINDTPNMSIDYIEYTSKLLQKETNHIQLIIIDYLQLIQVDHLQNDTRTQELSYITRKLKLLAQYLNIPIIILSQLNRSIETRINKEPLLSDLRESGCIDNQKNLTITTKPQNSINITTIETISYKDNILYLLNKTIKSSSIINKYTQPKLYIGLQYIFICTLYDKTQIKITHSHKYYQYHKWVKQYNILDNMIICKYNGIPKLSYIQENSYINTIIFIKYSQVYDINMIEYINFICQNTILHNSIEQDADIVMMLYEKTVKKCQDIDHKILDIILCKNRNGPTGTCQLLFTPHNTIFNNIQNSIINHI
uniref:Replicative DNA helicase n=1 Tax=Schimmelmannia schousboei TaxID=173468 RepID=A0A1C9C8Y3_9FLOR|nr:replication helicase subunit [Schimmelmannia schousboei]AOM64840.1 replication helicase subunit [Schimmelmannia schousboei]